MVNKYIVAGGAAAAAALAFLPYSWAHLAAGAVSAGLTAYSGITITNTVRDAIIAKNNTPKQG